MTNQRGGRFPDPYKDTRLFISPSLLRGKGTLISCCLPVGCDGAVVSVGVFSVGVGGGGVVTVGMGLWAS